MESEPQLNAELYELLTRDVGLTPEQIRRISELGIQMSMKVQEKSQLEIEREALIAKYERIKSEVEQLPQLEVRARATLQQLKITEARYGFSTEPRVMMKINDINHFLDRYHAFSRSLDLILIIMKRLAIEINQIKHFGNSTPTHILTDVSEGLLEIESKLHSIRPIPEL